MEFCSNPCKCTPIRTDFPVICATEPIHENCMKAAVKTNALMKKTEHAIVACS